MNETDDFQKSDSPEKSGTKTKRLSSIALVSIILGVTELLILWFNPTVALVVGILAMMSCIKAAREMDKGIGRLKRWSAILIGGLLPPVTLTVSAYWSIDTPDIPNDYTVADLRATAPEYDSSYEILCRLNCEDDNDPGALAIGLSQQDLEILERVGRVTSKRGFHEACKAIDQNAPDIELLWNNSQKGREIIEELAGFPEISDHTEPSLDEVPALFLRNVRRLTFIYGNYCCLQARQGHGAQAVQELGKIQSFAKAFNLNCRPLVSKLVCIATFACNMDAASFIVNCPQTSDTVIHELANHFPPLTDADINMRNTFINEYLMFRSAVDQVERESREKQLMNGSGLRFIKRNSLLRLYRNMVDGWMCRDGQSLRIWPKIYPNLEVVSDQDSKLPWYYTLYNPHGSSLVQIMAPAADRVLMLHTKWQIHNELLQIVMKRRLGIDASLKARAYSDAYIIDPEQQVIFSPGPDREAYTDDDIKLMINVELYRDNRTSGIDAQE